LDTRITLRKLEIFELVVELESVSQAADKLWLAQPSTSGLPTSSAAPPR
jgi:DNA-binding transcriptional LysR family regulator